MSAREKKRACKKRNTYTAIKNHGGTTDVKARKIASIIALEINALSPFVVYLSGETDYALDNRNFAEHIQEHDTV